jgi:hypothetical protein
MTSLIGPFPEMANGTLIHSQARVEVSYQLLVQKSDLFADDPTLGPCPYTLRTEILLADFREFVATLKGQPVTIKKDPFGGLSRFSDEFGFRDLMTRLSRFREFGELKEEALRLSALEERMNRLEALL